MKKFSAETVVGIFVLVGFAAFAFVAIKLGEIRLPGQGVYQLNARFDSVSGLKPGAPVELAGVRVGSVRDIDIDAEMFEAVVRFEVEDRVELPEDTMASIRTSGIIGDKFVKLTPGGSDENLKDGSLIVDTESAISLEELVSKYIFESDAEKP